ncbi:MAG TPA: phosphoglycerate mutase [Intrasporangiaceae bacterium]|nr:phosphoglycerate mutase [Intrasporangiaceae bacterium]
MTTCLLIRHGQSRANVDGVLAGRLDSALTDDGLAQARQVAADLSAVPLRQVVTSPLTRCLATAEEITTIHPGGLTPVLDDRFVEVGYGAWTGRSLKELADDPLWATIQSTPSTVTFPASDEHVSESMAGMSERAWAAWLEWEERISAVGEQSVWAVVSHGDLIKALLARALGLSLDAFQSIVVDPASVSIIQRHRGRTAVTGLNLRDDVYARLARVDADESDQEAGESNAGVVGGGNA